MKKKDRQSGNTGSDGQHRDMTFEYVHEDDGIHCVRCGGYMWPIHDADGLILYHKCGDCGAKK